MAHAHAILHEGHNAIDTYHWNTIDKSCCRGHYFTSAGPGMGYLAVAPLAVSEVLVHLLPSNSRARLSEKIRSQLESRCAPLIQAGVLSFDSVRNRVNLFEFHASIWVFEAFIAMMTSFNAVIFRRVLILFNVEPTLATKLAFVLPLGTVLFFYSRIGYSVAPSAFLLVLGFYLIASVALNPGPRPNDKALLIVSGLALGTAVALEYIQFIGAVLLFFYAWHALGTRRVWWVAAGGLPMGLLIMLYQYECFGSPFATPYHYLIPLFAPKLAPGVLGLTFPFPGRILSLLFGIRRGLFLCCPILFLCFLMLLRNLALRRRFFAETLLILALLGGYILFQASSSLAGETWGIGPRYAAVAAPFVLLGAVLATGAQPNPQDSFSRMTNPKLLISIGFFSVFINWLTVQRDIEAMGSPNPLWDAFKAFCAHGPSSDILEQTFSLTGLTSPLFTWSIGLAAYAGLSAVLFLFWRLSRPGDALGTPSPG